MVDHCVKLCITKNVICCEKPNFQRMVREGVQGPIRQRPDFREAGRAYRRLCGGRVGSTGQGNKSIHPAQQRRQNSQQQFDEHEEYASKVIWKPKSSALGNLWLHNKKWFRHDVSLVHTVVFRLPATFRSQAIDWCVNRARPHIACTDANKFFSTSHMMLHAHAWLKLNCVPKTSSHSIPCFAPCVTTCTVHRAFCLLFSLSSTSPSSTGSGSRLITSRDLRQVMSPKGPSTTRSSLSKRLSTPLKRVRFPKLRMRAKSWYTTRFLYHTTNHCCLRLKILLKALLRLKKQTWTTNKFVLCWLHHGIFRTEKQVRNDHKFVTLKEKVWCQVHLKVWTSGAQGNLCHGSHIRKDWVKTNFQKESNLLIFLRCSESIFRDANPANVAKFLLEGNRDHLLAQARSELMKQEHKVEFLNNCINELQQQAHAQQLELEGAITDTLNLDENKFDYKN